MVLADDMDGNGRMDLVLATMNGNVYCFETAASYHPLKAWPSQVRLSPLLHIQPLSSHVQFSTLPSRPCRIFLASEDRQGLYTGAKLDGPNGEHDPFSPSLCGLKSLPARPSR